MKENPKVKFITLGCKVNQYETQGMREILQKAGIQNVSARQNGEAVDYVVVNTCTVTADADKENRYWIRRARRENPGAKIVVTGCGVERNRKDYEALTEVDLILQNHQKARIADYVPCHSERRSGVILSAAKDLSPEMLRFAQHDNRRPQADKHNYTPLSISETEGSGRAFVKIQDGCNHACSFCKVVMVRGRSRSRDLRDVIEEVIRLRDAGYREIVFAGIQLGAYGHDLGQSEAQGLIEALEACSQIEGIERLRLSSIEPTDVKPELIAALRDLPKACHQLHIPLQSGDDEILKQMNRRYGRTFYRDLIAQLKSEMPDFCLSLDVMAGFATETEEQFQNTVDLLKEVKPLKCHVFPYSAREGTKAARLPSLPPSLVRDRVKRLIQCGDELSHNVRSPFLGQTMNVLAETFHSEQNLLQGLSANYLKVLFPGAEEQIGQMVSVKLSQLEADGFRGETA